MNVKYMTRLVTQNQTHKVIHLNIKTKTAKIGTSGTTYIYLQAPPTAAR